MHRFKLLFALLTLAGLVPAFATLQAQDEETKEASPGERVFRVQKPKSTVTLTESSSMIIEHSSRIKSVDGHDPEVVDIDAISPTQIRVEGLVSGVTDIVLTDEHGQHYQLEVFVVGNVRHLQKLLRHLYPHSSIDVIEVKGSVILRGWVTQPEHINQAIEIAETFYETVLNHMQVGGVQQVMLQCQIMEVQRSKLRRMGVNFFVNQVGDLQYFGSTPGPITPITDLGVGPGGATLGLSGFGESTLTLGVFSSNRIFQTFVQALRDEGLLRLHSKPSVVTTNGAPASILSGGEVPIVVPAGLGTVAIEFRSFGIQLDAVPIILGNGRVRLKLRPEVSERDFSSSVTVTGVSVPGFTVRRAETQVEMNFGETLAIGGLISRRETETAQKVPLFGELPWLGTFFSRKVSEMSETELVILVTPQYASALKPGEMPAGGPGQFTTFPTDKELYFQNLIEIPKYGEDCDACQDGRFALPTQGRGGQSGSCSCGKCRAGIGCGRQGSCAAPGTGISVAPAVTSPAVNTPPINSVPVQTQPIGAPPAAGTAPGPPPADPGTASGGGVPPSVGGEDLPGLIEPGSGGSN